MLYKGRSEKSHKKEVSHHICDIGTLVPHQQKQNYNTYSILYLLLWLYIYILFSLFGSGRHAYKVGYAPNRRIVLLMGLHPLHPFGYKSKICQYGMYTQSIPYIPYIQKGCKHHPIVKSKIRQECFTANLSKVTNISLQEKKQNPILINFDKSKNRSFVTTSYISKSAYTIDTSKSIKKSVYSVYNEYVKKVSSIGMENKNRYNKNLPLLLWGDKSSKILPINTEGVTNLRFVSTTTSKVIRGDGRSSYKPNSAYVGDIPKKSQGNQGSQASKARKRFIPGSSFKNRKIRGVLGKIYISTTKNNTIITLIDNKGNTKGWSCSGSLGFKNARKSTTYAAQAATENIVKKAKILGYTHLRLLVKGLGRGKQSCLRALSKSQLKIISIEDKTGVPYNGCRLSKKRRV